MQAKNGKTSSSPKNFLWPALRKATLLTMLGAGIFSSESIQAQTSKAIKDTLSVEKTSSQNPLIFANLNTLSSDQIIETMVEEINKIRQEYNLNSIRADERLCRAAQLHAEDMTKRKYFKHNSPEGITPEQRIIKQKYIVLDYRENLATWFNINDVLHAWIMSKPHAQSIVRSNMEDIGVGYSDGKTVLLLGKEMK